MTGDKAFHLGWFRLWTLTVTAGLQGQKVFRPNLLVTAGVKGDESFHQRPNLLVTAGVKGDESLHQRPNLLLTAGVLALKRGQIVPRSPSLLIELFQICWDWLHLHHFLLTSH